MIPQDHIFKYIYKKACMAHAPQAFLLYVLLAISFQLILFHSLLVGYLQLSKLELMSRLIFLRF